MRTVYSTILCFASSVCLLFLSSCNDCSTRVSQFENGDGSWTVYKTGDSLYMVSTLGRTDTVLFTNTRTSSDPVPGEGFTIADACIEQYDTRRTSVMQEVTRPKPRLPGLSVIAQRRPNDIQVTLAVSNRGSFQIPDINTPQHATLPIRGIPYRDVFELANPDSTLNGVRRIQFNKEYGFLRVEYFDGRTLERIPNPR